MAITIDTESRIYSGMLIDIDKCRLKYITKETDQSTDTEINIEFISPFIKVYENLKFFLLKNSIIKTLSPKNFYRPDYVSYSEWGTTQLWTLLLFVNDISTIEEFDVSEIYVPDKSVISSIISNIISSLPVININTSQLTSRDSQAKLFEKKESPILQNTYQALSASQDLDQKFYFVTQIFPIRNVIVSQRFLDLRYAAVPASVDFKVQNQPNFIYGVHYTLISNAGTLSRITWSKKYTTIGLEDIISEGDIVQVSYAREV
jgi:hypothetical protein